MTENVQLSDQDRTDLKNMGIDPGAEDAPAERSLLTIWDEILKAGRRVGSDPIPMFVAAKVVASWPKLSYQDTVRYHELYHELLGTLHAALVEVIRTNPDAVNFVGLADAEENRELYIGLLVEWNLLLDDFEQNWSAASSQSHIEVAAVVDVRGFVFSDTGLAGHLGAIGFQLEDGEFFERLNAAKAER